MKGNECLFSLNKTPLIRPVPESTHSKPTASSDILGTQIELAEDSTECELSVFSFVQVTGRSLMNHWLKSCLAFLKPSKVFTVYSSERNEGKRD